MLRLCACGAKWPEAHSLRQRRMAQSAPFALWALVALWPLLALFIAAIHCSTSPLESLARSAPEEKPVSRPQTGLHRNNLKRLTLFQKENVSLPASL